MSRQILFVALLLLLVVLGVVIYLAPLRSSPRPVACTMEAKLCPDGSAVGRTGPNCEFAACLEATSTSTLPHGGPGEGIVLYHAGIRGTVMLGPTCPVERIPPDPQCADKPYNTLVTIFRASDPVHPFTLVQDNADGTFEASLPSGEYVVHAGGRSIMPRCNPVSVTVAPNAYVSATITCDTGIR